MLLWICFALMTAAVTVALLRPLWRSDAKVLAPAEADLAVYRDQLKEIDADRERGLIGAAEAEGAKTEVARRILAQAGGAAGTASDAAGPAGTTLTSRPSASLTQRIATATAALVPILSVAVYLWAGSPAAPDRPLAARETVPVEQATIQDLVGRVEARLAQKPNDAEGWNVIAPIYMRLGRFDDAANAFARILALKGESADGLARFAEATIAAGNGMVTDPARRAYLRILELDPARTDAVFGLALAREQDGDLAAALSDYRKLLAGAPPDANWKTALEERIKALEDRQGGRAPVPAPQVAAPAASGATPDGMAKMSPEEREKTILAMVDALAARLKVHGNDLAGWQRLIRAYRVLGRDADVTDALAEARRNFAGDAKALGEIDALDKSLKKGS